MCHQPRRQQLDEQGVRAYHIKRHSSLYTESNGDFISAKLDQGSNSPYLRSKESPHWGAMDTSKHHKLGFYHLEVEDLRISMGFPLGLFYKRFT